MPERLFELTNVQLQQHQAADLMRALSAAAFARGMGGNPADHFVERWPTSLSRSTVVQTFTKAAVLPGTTTDSSWAAPLMPSELASAFMPLITAESALLRLPLARVPFNSKVSRQTADASYSWVSESGVKPVSQFQFANTATVSPYKASGIVVIDKELVRLANPGSVPAMQRALATGLAYWLDQQFFDPTKAAVTGTNPASITNGLTPVAVSGTLPEQIAQLLAAFYAARPQASAQTTLVVSPATHGRIPVRDLPNVPIVTTPAVGAYAIVLDPTAVLIARDDALQLSVSEEAAVQLDTAPASPPTAAVTIVSFWQMNLIGIRSEIAASWLPLPTSVAYATVT